MRPLVVACIIVLLVLSVFFSSFVHAATKHGCAPITPPTVTGTLTQPAAISGILFINEVLLVPHSTWNCSELGTYTPTNDTWAEIYNSQNQSFDLYGVHASIDSGPNTNPFYFPFGSAIAPHGFLVVFPRTDANFLATETSTWRLLISGVPVDAVKIPTLGEDQSYARVPDGSSTWQILSSPTIDASNDQLLATPTLTKSDLTATARASRGSNTRSGVGTSDGGSYGGGGGGGDSGGGTTGGGQVDGVQPAWAKLALPGTTPVSVTAGTPGSSPSSPAQSVGSMDISHKILLTVLVVALALALLWCWRLFRVS